MSELSRDSRKSTADVARALKIPRVTVHERIERLKEKKVIKQFTVKPDYALLGRPTTAFVLVRFSSNPVKTQRQLAKEIALIKGVEEVYIITGEWDLLLKTRSESLEKLGQLVVDRLREIKGVGTTMTTPVLSTAKE